MGDIIVIPQTKQVYPMIWGSFQNIWRRLRKEHEWISYAPQTYSDWDGVL